MREMCYEQLQRPLQSSWHNTQHLQPSALNPQPNQRDTDLGEHTVYSTVPHLLGFISGCDGLSLCTLYALWCSPISGHCVSGWQHLRREQVLYQHSEGVWCMHWMRRHERGDEFFVRPGHVL